MTDAELGRQIAAYLDATTQPVAPTTDHRTEVTMTTIEPVSGFSRGRWLGAAAAALVLVAVGAIALSIRDGDDEDEAATTSPPPTVADENTESIPPPSENAELTPKEREAIDLAERYFAALYAGDVETAIEMVPQLTLREDAETAWVEWWSIHADDPDASDEKWPTGPCDVGSRSPEGLLITCPVESHDLLAVAMGLDQLVWRVHITDEGEVATFLAPAAGFQSYLDQSVAYAAYLQATDSFVGGVCDADAYGPGAVYDPGVAMNSACAELIVDVAADAATWFEAGQPDQWPIAES